MDSMSQRLFNPPPVLGGISRVTSVKILGVTITNKLSVSDHVRHVIVSLTLHALRVLRCHGMNDAALKTVYQAVVISRLLDAASA